ncbi:cysteine desulfurase family protein [Amycolatopsis taiwanensis]|uniref:Cysteine desulfurase n=1 Tax=Amycolatopsis taiwanensis TaxID=342230 RepID=A0A9W6QW72_9PSEU|nr:cysteine desulfurase family protein [Amycolatopsis taiwanensis]GLY65194.1 cysteine desulfurase [Amycolatopsis taiwanensis]
MDSAEGRVSTVRDGLAYGPIYLDYNATTPIDPAATTAMLPFLGGAFGNPSSDHHYGVVPRSALQRAREQVATLVGAPDALVVFTGSGSEADNLALRGVALASGWDRPRIVTQCTEHPAILRTCQALSRWHGVEVTYLPVSHDGLVDPADLDAALSEETVLVSIMLANNETGALQPVDELAQITHRHGALFHCDAAQAAGKIPIEATRLGVDLLTVVGHKMYAPKGIAALCLRPGLPLEPLIYGGGQEHGLRAGTENVALAVALGAAAQVATHELAAAGHHRIRRLRDHLHGQLSAGLPGRVLLNGPVEARLPNTLNVSIPGTTGHELLAAVPEIAASTGSACHSGDHEPSPVLAAMGFDADRSLSALRLSLGRWSTRAELDRAAELIVAAARSHARY